MEDEYRKASFTTGRIAKGKYLVDLRGSLDNRHTGALWMDLVAFLEEEGPSAIICDFKDVTGMDTSGIAMLKLIHDRCNEMGIEFSRRNLPQSAENFLHARPRASGGKETQAATCPGPISSLGIWAVKVLNGLHERTEFLGRLLATCVSVVRHPGQFGFGNFLLHIQKVGSEAVFLVIALSALMGLVIVFQGLETTRRLGSDVYIANMVALSVTAQMAPLLTAIIVSGRSGAAFAAEIGSMKIRQELDLLSVMNFDIFGFLILPRIFAIAIATPFLTIISDAAGIVGGAVTSRIVMDLPLSLFFQQVKNALSFNAIISGLIKGVVFGVLIGMTGCFHGLGTKNTTGSIGNQTTAAVVSGILLIVLANSVFAYLFS